MVGSADGEDPRERTRERLPSAMRFGLTVSFDASTGSSDIISHNYVSYLEGLGVEPILVSNAISHPRSYIAALDVQGMVFTAGNNISPRSYGEGSMPCTGISDIRDMVERELLRTAVDEDLSVFGVCRGMQFINVFFGGTLDRDIPSKVGETVNHMGHSHVNRVVHPGIERWLTASTFTVNSFHDQGVTLDSMSPALEVFAVCEGDGLVEGILHPSRPILGSQWHPEREGSSQEHDLRLVRGVLQGAFWRR